MGRGKSKGSGFEREVCRILSSWLSGGKADDYFWRSAGSGSRATTRAKCGKGTRGHAGDIAPTCREAEVLTNLVAIEVKRGYPRSSLMDLYDRSDRSKQQLFESWVCQARASQEASGAQSWWLISRRDRCESVITMPKEFMNAIAGMQKKMKWSMKVSSKVVCRCEQQSTFHIVTVLFEEFLQNTKPATVRRLNQWLTNPQ